MESTFAQYGRVYSDISRGYTRATIEGESYFFKHPNQAEHFEIFGQYHYILSSAKKRGLMTEEEKVEQAIKNGWWTKDKENRFIYLKEIIKNLKKTQSNLLLPSQRDQIQSQIDKNNFILVTFAKERNELIGYTAEKYSYDRLYDETVISLTFKDSNLTEKVFSDPEDYYYLSDTLVENIRSTFRDHSDILNGNIVKYIAASPFFQNMLYVTNECDAFHFWGKPASKCTKHQIDLLINGKLYKNVVKSEAENGRSIPEDLSSDPVKFVNWYESRNSEIERGGSMQSNGSRSQTAVSSFVGATKEDLKKMGVKIEKIRGKSLLDMAAENGGVLEKHQYLNARDGS